MGFLFTVGSFAFVRAFEDPPQAPLFPYIGSDELLGAWVTFLGCFPAVFYTLVFVVSDPHSIIYWGGFVASILFTIGAALFVYACYGGEKDRRPYIRTFFQLFLWKDASILKHVANDWLAACWFFFLCSLAWFGGSIGYLFISKNDRQDLIYASSLIDSMLFLIGSAYFVAGSYPIEIPVVPTSSLFKGKSSSATDPNDVYIDTTTTNTLHLANAV